MYKQSSLEDEPTVFFDPNALSSDGTIALSTRSFSQDGSLMAYGLSKSGSDWAKIQIRNVETGKDYPDLLERTKYPTISWTQDKKGFFYNVSEHRGANSLLHQKWTKSRAKFGFILKILIVSAFS